MRVSIAIIAFAFLSTIDFTQACCAGGPADSKRKAISISEYSNKANLFASQQVGMLSNNSFVAKANGQSASRAASFVGDLASNGQVIEGTGGGCAPRSYGYPDLFYNYYTQGFCNVSNAQMYLCPRPVPPFVGNTYFTYQPWYPEEMLYWHKNRYHNYYDGGRGMDHTRVIYMAPPIRTAWSNLYWNKIRIPR